jgi:hypothetical protein
MDQPDLITGPPSVCDLHRLIAPAGILLFYPDGPVEVLRGRDVPCDAWTYDGSSAVLLVPGKIGSVMVRPGRVNESDMLALIPR